MRLGKLWVDGQGPIGELLCPLVMNGRRIRIAIDGVFDLRETGESRSVIGIQLKGGFKMFGCVLEGLWLVLVAKQRAPHQKFVVRLRILRVTVLHCLLLLRTEMQM